ncbi:MAG: hypothetical protein WC850_01355 [Candidatus Gracilibacteria bacterium]
MQIFKSGIEKVDKILKSIIDGKVHIQSSREEICNKENVLDTINEIKLRILGVIEIDSTEKELKFLIEEYFKNQKNKRELRKIGIKIIRLIYRIKSSYNKSNGKLKKVNLSDDVKCLVKSYYTTEENGNLIESLLLERLIIDSTEDKQTEIIITPDLLDHKKIDFILRTLFNEIDLKIGTQVTFTNGSHKLRKCIEIENLACEIDRPSLDNPYEQEHYRKIKLDELKSLFTPDITAFISINTKFGDDLSGTDKLRLKRKFTSNLGKNNVGFLQDSLKDYEKELFRDISLGYLAASKEIGNFIKNGIFKKELDIPDSQYKIKFGKYDKNNSSINLRIQYEGFILADITYFITNKAMKKNKDTNIIMKKRLLKEKK